MTDDEVIRAASIGQHRLMRWLWGQTGVDRRGRLAVTSQIIGRHIESSTELTIVEASNLIDELKAALGMPIREKEPQ